MAPRSNPLPTPDWERCRRSDLRLQILGQLYGHIVALDLPLIVQDLSAGGFAVESQISFFPGASHQFRFTTSAGTPIVVHAQAIHCHPIIGPDAKQRFLAGFEFLKDPDDTDAKEAVDALLDVALSALTFH